MTAALRPVQIAAYVALVAMVVAAYFGTAFNVLLALAASFPLLFFFGADRRPRDGVTVSMGVTCSAPSGSACRWSTRCCCATCPTTARRC